MPYPTAGVRGRRKNFLSLRDEFGFLDRTADAVLVVQANAHRFEREPAGPESNCSAYRAPESRASIASELSRVL
jgi:hypothetical protein